jgi:hypothetical protein
MTLQPRRRRFAGASAPTGRQPIHYESLNEDTEQEEAEEPAEQERPQLSSRVQELINEAARARREAQQNKGNAETVDDDMSPAERLAAVSKSSPAYAKEYRLRLIHRLLLRNIPLDQIADQLDISVRTVQRDREEIGRRLRKEAARLDVNVLLGETMAFYKEHAAMALRIATSAKTPLASRLAALRTSMQSRKEMGQWLSVAGVFEVLKFHAEENAGNADIARLVKIAEDLMGDEKEIGTLGDLQDTDDDLDESIQMFL